LYLLNTQIKTQIARISDQTESLQNKKTDLNPVDNFQKAKDHFLEGIQHLENGAFEEAEREFLASLEFAPDRVSTLTNLGAAQVKLKKYLEARATCEKVIVLDENNPEVLLNLGLVHKELEDLENALSYFDRATDIEPNSAQAWTNRGSALYDLSRYQESVISHDRAIAINNQYADAWFSKGLAHLALKDYQGALGDFKTTFELDPKHEYLLGALINTKLLIGDWDQLEEDILLITEAIEKGLTASTPFPLMSAIDDPKLHLITAKQWANAEYPSTLILPAIPKRQHAKIRIGYFSPDFRDHAVSLLTAQLFELHDRNLFEVFAFSLKEYPSPDQMRERLISGFDQFINVEDKSDLEVAQLTRELEIDIAIDLCGYTLYGRPGIFAYRAAPIQVSYIGYLGSLGAEYIDYLIADKTIIPENSKEYYSEKIVFLPSYQVNDSSRKISEKAFAREDLGLPMDGFVFTCFNNNYKFNPETFDSWMRILKATTGSALFLYADNELSQSNLIRQAEIRGVSGQRIVFGKRIPKEEYLSRYQACDLFLDTTPYNAGTTASDALWAGVPVITLIGESFPSRVAASLLNAIHLPELITHSREEYESLAISLATNPEQFAELKKKLSGNRSSAPLFNTPLFARNIEAAYQKMYKRYQEDLPPDHLYID